MQTFLPYPDYNSSAQDLDSLRLNKQCIEASQILKTLLTGKGWVHHPIVKMWSGYEFSLCYYLKACIDECDKRGIKTQKHKSNFEHYLAIFRSQIEKKPTWIGDKGFHLSHKSNLLKKGFADVLFSCIKQICKLKKQTYSSSKTWIAQNASKYQITKKTKGEIPAEELKRLFGEIVLVNQDQFKIQIPSNHYQKYAEQVDITLPYIWFETVLNSPNQMI